MRNKLLLLSLSILLLSALRVEAATYTVKAGGGGNYTTIGACAAVAVAGDSCVAYAGSYSGWTQSHSGTSGNPITFTTNSGDTVNVTSGITVSGASYVKIENFSNISGGVSGNNATNHVIITHNSFSGCGPGFQISDGQGGNGSDNVFSYNTLVGGAGNCVGVYLYGDRNLIEHNDLSTTDGDCMDLGGANVVVRNNYCHDVDGKISGQHIDFVQVIGGGTSPTMSFSLIENNVERNCTNDGSNCHFVIVRTGGPTADTIIVRYNYAQNLDSAGPIAAGGVGDNVPNLWLYNNTISTAATDSENGSCASWQNASSGASYNNICYGTSAATSSWSPFYDYSSGGLVENGNLVYTPGYSGGWNSPYSSEGTYSALHNQNPLFANYPTDGSLQAGSPARNAGVALTTVAAGDSGSGTTLVVGNAHGFQPGWAGTQADWIRIGASTTVQIAAINYSTNTITLASPVSRSAGNPVYIYKNSSGAVVLNGANPDVGAYPFGSAASGSQNGPLPPTNLKAIVN